MAKVKKRMPGGKVIIYKGGKPKTARCANCKKPLHGFPRAIPSKIAKLAKSRKRPTRAYSGYLCVACLKELLKERVRGV